VTAGAKISGFDRALVEPLHDVTPATHELRAVLNAHGIYATEQFVLRLSPRVHELVDAITRGETDGYDRADLVRAYSTYLHETIHWWQHVGTTSGVILSLCYPTQCIGSLGQLREVADGTRPEKSLLKWAEDALRGTTIADSDTLAAANIAVNNAADVDFYKRFQFDPLGAPALYENRYFESIGHCYFIAYGSVINAVRDSCGFDPTSLPDPSAWEPIYQQLRARKHEGFYHGSPVRRARVGLREIFEGQARLSQVQFLASAGGPPEWSFYEAEGYFRDEYIAAYDEFSRLTGVDRPTRVDDPVASLFLLICDMALNPYRGLPLEIENFPDLIRDLDPGARFTFLSEAVCRRPSLLSAIRKHDATDYWTTASALAEESGFDDPRLGLERIAAIAKEDPGARQLLRERETFQFSESNLPIRVIAAEFLAFSQDKLHCPEFFCWPGLHAAGERIDAQYQALFKNHLSYFSDRGETEQIFVRDLPGKDPEGLKHMLETFFGSLILYDLTLQWVLREGPFRYDFKWLTGRSANDELVTWAKASFRANFGIDLDEFEILAP
jgi:hypothetical protein